MLTTTRVHRAGLVLALAIATTSGAHAQRFPDIQLVEIRPGLYLPTDADAGFGVAGDVDLGWIYYTNLRVIVGTHKFSADVDPESTGDEGLYSAFGGRAGFRLELFRLGTVMPHLIAAVTGTQVDADIVDPRSDELLDGFYAGADFGVGAAMPITRNQRFSAVAEWRRSFASNISRYVLDFGIRISFVQP